MSEPIQSSIHVSVMPDEVLQWLEPCTQGVILDGTFGGGGHSRMLAAVCSKSGGRVVGVDRDERAVEAARDSLQELPVRLVCASYHELDLICSEADVERFSGALVDLGLSSDQLEDTSRGFSFQQDGPLDLRFDDSRGRSAKEFLAQATEKQIADTIYEYGEERFSRRIAKQIVLRRQERRSVKTVFELVDICRRCVPRSKNHDIHPATRTFQALRIAVNDELNILQKLLRDLPERMEPGARLCVISFHSLEDRIVKNAFRDDERWEVLTKKPLRPSDAEVQNNPRSRSAKMRVAARKVN